MKVLLLQMEIALDLYSLFLRHFLKLTSNDPLKAGEISKRLDLEKSQVNAWLKRGIADGQIEKIKPVAWVKLVWQYAQAHLGYIYVGNIKNPD